VDWPAIAFWVALLVVALVGLALRALGWI